MENPDPGVLVELDERRRVSLGRVGHHGRYLARTERDGTIILTPAVVMTVAALERMHPGAELELIVGPEKAKEIGATYDDDPSTLATRTRRPREPIRQQILEIVRAAGADGIAVKDIIAKVDGGRSSIFNELAVMRRTEVVQNLSGTYIIGPEAPPA